MIKTVPFGVLERKRDLEVDQQMRPSLRTEEDTLGFPLLGWYIFAFSYFHIFLFSYLHIFLFHQLTIHGIYVSTTDNEDMIVHQHLSTLYIVPLYILYAGGCLRRINDTQTVMRVRAAL